MPPTIADVTLGQRRLLILDLQHRVPGQLALAVGAWLGWDLHKRNQRRLDRLHQLKLEEITINEPT